MYHKFQMRQKSVAKPDSGLYLALIRKIQGGSNGPLERKNEESQTLSSLVSCYLERPLFKMFSVFLNFSDFWFKKMCLDPDLDWAEKAWIRIQIQ